MSMTDWGHVPPDPRVKELEAEVERLRDSVEKLRTALAALLEAERMMLDLMVKALKREGA